MDNLGHASDGGSLFLAQRYGTDRLHIVVEVVVEREVNEGVTHLALVTAPFKPVTSRVKRMEGTPSESSWLWVQAPQKSHGRI